MDNLKVLPDDKLFLNYDPEHNCIDERVPLPEFLKELKVKLSLANRELKNFAVSSRVFERKLSDDYKDRILKSHSHIAETNANREYLYGFPLSRLECHEQTLDYFDHVPVNRNFCDGAYAKLQQMLHSRHTFDPHLWPLLLMIAAMASIVLMPHPCITVALMAAAAIKLFTEYTEVIHNSLISSIHTVFCIGLGFVTVMFLVGSGYDMPADIEKFQNLRPIAFACFGAGIVVILLEYVYQLFLFTKNRAIEKEFCDFFEEHSYWSYRYIRYHVI